MRLSLLTALLLITGLVWARPLVITSIYPYYSLTRQLADGLAEVVLLLPPGASPHTFALTPRAVAQLTRADLVIMNGGLDAWLEQAVAASGTRAPLLEVLATLPQEVLIGSAGKDTLDRFGVNPHVWLDPVLMEEVVMRIARELAGLDAEHAELYLDRGADLKRQLQALHEELQQTLFPLQGEPFIPFHDSWPYFARRYGLELVVEIEPFPGRQPSPRYLTQVVSLIRQSGARAIFTERQLDPRPAVVVAEAAGVMLYALDPLGGGDAAEYQDLLRHNAQVLLEGLLPPHPQPTTGP